jgi:predicted nucleotidyltransferase
VFSIEDRDRLRDRVLDLAASDPRVVAGAIVGSLARDGGDRWSDLDLMFAVSKEVQVAEVFEDWTGMLEREFDAVQLFDLPSGAIVYRVFILPNCLELDLSLTPAATFGPAGEKVRLLFGETSEQPEEPPVRAEELLGYAVHHALHARACIERGRYWQAEYWISAVRDYALHLACRKRGLDGWYGRDFDALPPEVLAPLNAALVRSLERQELDRALARAVDGLLRESTEAGEMAKAVEPQLRELASL